MKKKNKVFSRLFIPIASLVLLPVLVFSFVNSPSLLKDSQRTLFEIIEKTLPQDDRFKHKDSGQVLGDAADCPSVLSGDITGVVVLDSSDYSLNNYEIDCSTEDILITSTGVLQINPDYVNDASHENDYSLTIYARNFEIQTGGLLDLEGRGYDSGEQEMHIGSGKASDTVETCGGGACGGSGGGHGGAGGRGDTDNIGTTGNPGQSYGEKYTPVTLGSGGGISATGSLGGAGGGAIKIEVLEVFTLNGQINASGTDGFSDQGNAGGGGAAGGSIWIEAAEFEGSGEAIAKGGDGGVSVQTGGGGGGGRINMTCTQANISTFSADATKGLGNQHNGQDGSVVGPSCKPITPNDLRQYAIIETTKPYTYTEIELEQGDGTRSQSVVLRFEIADIETSSTLYPQIELREVGEDFLGTYTHTLPAESYSGTPIIVELRIDNLEKTKEYKWR